MMFGGAPPLLHLSPEPSRRWSSGLPDVSLSRLEKAQRAGRPARQPVSMCLSSPSMPRCLRLFSLFLLLFLCSTSKVGAASGMRDVHRQCDFLLCPTHPLHPPLTLAPPQSIHPSIHESIPSCTPPHSPPNWTHWRYLIMAALCLKIPLC